MIERSRILVAGATGLVGRNLTEKLASQGAFVRAVSRTRTFPYVHHNIENFRCDLTRKSNCENAVKNVDYVVLCAASTAGAATIASTPMVHVTPNVLINSQMLEAAANAGVKKFIWLSSTTGYPPSDDAYVTEDQMFDGEPYEKYYYVGWMKRFTEVLCNMYSNKLELMPTVVLRPTNIFGPHDKFDPQKSHVLPALIRKAAERQDPFEVWGDGNDIRDFIYVDDMVDAILLALKKLDSYDPINIGMGKTYTVREILDIILGIEGYSPEVVYNSDRPSMIPVRKVNVDKAKQLLDFDAKVGIEEGIRRTMEWYKCEYLQS